MKQFKCPATHAYAPCRSGATSNGMVFHKCSGVDDVSSLVTSGWQDRVANKLRPELNRHSLFVIPSIERSIRLLLLRP